MTSQVIFTVDRALKDRAMRRARTEGIPFAAVLKLATRAFADGSLNVRLTEEDPPLNAKAAKQLNQALADIRHGRKLSPSFQTANEAMRYLQGA